jgi:hypothetical protein
MFYTMLHLLC